MKLNTRLSQEETQQIIDHLNAFTRAWNAKDLQQFGALFTEDAEFTDVVGQTALGKSAIINQHRFPFERVMKEATLEIVEAYIRQIEAGLVILSGKWQVTGSQTPAGKSLPIRTGVIQIVWKKGAVGYKISLVHNADHHLSFQRRDGFIE